MDARATSQIWPDLPNCRVKGWAGHLGRPVRGRHLIDALMPGCQIRETVVLNLDTFRPACRAGGVDDVSKVAGVRSAECGVRSGQRASFIPHSALRTPHSRQRVHAEDFEIQGPGIE